MINKEVVKEQLAQNQERIVYAQETVKRINEEKVNDPKNLSIRTR